MCCNVLTGSPLSSALSRAESEAADGRGLSRVRLRRSGRRIDGRRSGQRREGHFAAAHGCTVRHGQHSQVESKEAEMLPRLVRELTVGVLALAVLVLLSRAKNIPCMKVLIRNGMNVNTGDANEAPVLSVHTRDWTAVDTVRAKICMRAQSAPRGRACSLLFFVFAPRVLCLHTSSFVGLAASVLTATSSWQPAISTASIS